MTTKKNLEELLKNLVVAGIEDKVYDEDLNPGCKDWEPTVIVYLESSHPDLISCVIEVPKKILNDYDLTNTHKKNN